MKYSLQTKKATFVTEDEFLFDLQAFPNGTISYQRLEWTELDKCIILRTENTWILNIVDYVKEVYLIEPTFIETYLWEYFLIFNLDKWLTGNNLLILTKKLSYLYKANYSLHHFYSESIQEKIYTSEKKVFNKNILWLKLSFLLNKEDFHIKFSDENFEEYNKVNKIPITEIHDKLWVYNEDVDILNNIHTEYWLPFHSVMKRMKSNQKTMEWFNQNYETNFNTESLVEQIENKWKGVLVKEWDFFYSDDRWYYYEKDSTRVYASDFIINVLYKIARDDNKFSYVVSLINPQEWDITKPLVWVDAVNKIKTMEFTQAYWNFHILSYNQIVFTEIHSILCQANVPTINEINYFWLNKEQNMIVFKNWIFDIKTKVFTDRPEWEEYFFNGSDWYKIVDKNWNNLENILWNQIPVYKHEKEVTNADMLKFCKETYLDNTWFYAFMIITWLLWNMLFAPDKLNFPLLFTRWVTWSWKSTFNELIMKIFGIKSSLAMTNITPFSMIVNLSYLNKIPVFFTEFRQNIPSVDVKVGTLRSVFDKTWDAKWRPDQTLVKYDYVWIPVIDWEEMIVDWALRTRSIQKQFIKWHKIQWNYKLIVEQHSETLSNFLWTYLDKINSTQEKYLEYFKHAYEFFYNIDNSSTRIIDNMAIMYAWAMVYMPENEDLILETLTELLMFQIKDYKLSSTDYQIIRLMAKFLESYNSNYWAIHDIEDKEDIKNSFIVVSWNALVEYQNSKKIKLTLEIDTYMEHLSWMWYVVDYYYDSVEQKNIFWVKIPYSNIPKEFTTHKTFYEANKKFKNDKMGKSTKI